jgi:predicted MPP superfamily phosphohydrolase
VSQTVVFLSVVLLVPTLIHYYLWRRLVRNTTRPGRARRIGTWAVVGLAVLILASFIGSRALPESASAVFAWTGFLWLALMFYLVVTLAVLELPALVARLVLRRRASRTVVVSEQVPVGALVGSDPGPTPRALDEPEAGTAPASLPGGATAGALDESRRLFLARTVAITAGVASVGLVGSGIPVALGTPRIKRIPITLARLPRAADGLKIAVVADIHVGPIRGAARMRRVVDMINDLEADIVTVVGDTVDGSVAQLGRATAPLGELRARLGTYIVTGNHEYYSGYEEWNAEYARLGLRVLRNEREELPIGVDLAGVNDLQGRQFSDGPDIGMALDGRDPARVAIMLAHQPAQAAEAARHGVDLQLSGHTHGGQMVPFNLIVRASGQPVVSGLGQVDGMPVYVTNGAGFWGPPVRVGAPPDISLVELRAP